MKLYRAETGKSIDWKSSLKTQIESLEDLLNAVEQCTGVPPASQILMTSYGKIVKQANVKEVVESIGEKEYIVFCYDRDFLIAHPDQISGLLDRETPSLEPDIPVFDGAATLKQLQQSAKTMSITENCDAYVRLFVKFDAYSRTLIEAASVHTSLAVETVDEQKLQSMALSVALANLRTHIRTGSQTANYFIELAKKEMSRQSNLLKSLQNDIEILRHTSIHHSILQLLDPSSRQNKIKLSDFIDLSQIDKTKAETIDLCNYLKHEASELYTITQELVKFEQNLQEHIAEKSNLQSLDATLSDIKMLANKAKQCREDTKKSLPKIYETISKLTDKPISTLFENLSVSPALERYSDTQRTPHKISNSAARKKFDSFNHLILYQLEDPIPKLETCEAKIRHSVDELIESKRTSIMEFFKNMKIISEIQGLIQDMEQQSKEASDRLFQFKKTYGKNDLESIRQISFAYGALLIEIVRRKEYVKVLVKNSNLLADVLAGFRLDEEKRRDKFRKEITKLLPFRLTGFDMSSPQSEITLTGTSTELDNTILDKHDVTEFISLLETVYFQSTSHVTSLGRRASHLSSSSASYSSINNQKKSLSLSPSKSSRFATGRNVNDESLLAFLNVMFKQLADMRMDFLKTLETNFFNLNKINIDPSKMKEALENEDMFSTTKSIPPPIKASPKQAEEQRVQSPRQRFTPSRSDSTDSSTFSVVEDDKKLIQATIAENNELKTKLEAAIEESANAKEIQSKQELEIKELKETLKDLENEKEEFESHIQNLDQLVDNERQNFEQNRRSFLNELKNKDKSADFRIASAEEDFQSKINDLQYAFEEEKRMKKNLEIEHASELNTLHTVHESEIDHFRTLLREEEQKTQDIQNENWELKQRTEQLEEDMASIKSKLEMERVEFEDHISHLQVELEDKEKATDEIKLLQQQTRSMVKRAQDDWESKNEELKKIKLEQEAVNTDIRDLLYRFRQDQPTDVGLRTDIYNFRESLEDFTKRYDNLQYNFEALTQEFTEISESYKNVIEVNNEWRSIASHMAERLEEFRKNVIFELVQKLQLSIDQDDLNVLSRNLTPSDDDTAIWNEILQLSSAISTQKFVLSILDNVKSHHDHSYTYKTQYRSIKDSYRKVLASSSEKISFRNFKVGDVALFLPTRNSTGKPWAAFNIGAPHYFLQSTENIVQEMESKEWIVARIVSIEEHTVSDDNESSNPYGLSHGLTYYNLTVENWRLNRRHASSSKTKKRLLEATQDSGLASIGSPSTIATIPTMRRPSLIAASSSTNNIVHSYAKQKED